MQDKDFRPTSCVQQIPRGSLGRRISSSQAWNMYLFTLVPRVVRDDMGAKEEVPSRLEP